MKSLVCAVIVMTAVAAEPPLHRVARFRSARQELAAEKEPTTPKNDPYPAAGYRPDREFNLPNQQPPANTYGLPANSYGAPVSVYGVPTEYGAPRTDSVETTTEDNQQKEEEGSGAEDSIDDGKSQKLQSDSYRTASGAYYVLLPDNRLQLVRYTTQNDVANMAYTARLQYRTEDRAPVYVYAAVPDYTNGATVQWLK